MLKVLKTREQFLLYVIFGLVSLSFVFNLIAYPLLQKNRSLDIEISKTRLKLMKCLDVLSRKDELKNISPDFSFGSTAFEQKQDTTVAVLAELEYLSQKAAIKILDIRPQSITRASGTREVSFDLRAEGEIDSYVKFIYEIENSVFLLKLKKIMLRAKPDSSSIEGTFTITQN